MNLIKIRGKAIKNKEGQLYDVFKVDFTDKKTNEQREFKSYNFSIKDEKNIYRCKSSFEPDLDILSEDEIIVTGEYVNKYDSEKKVSYTHFQIEDIKKSSF